MREQFLRRAHTSVNALLGLNDDQADEFHWNLKFRDEKLESAFTAVRRRQKYMMSGPIIWVTAVCWVLFLGVDFSYPGWLGYVRGAWRISLFFNLVIIGLFRRKYKAFFTRWLDVIYIVNFFVYYVSVDFFNHFSGPFDFQLPFALMLIIFMEQTFSGMPATTLLIVTLLEVLSSLLMLLARDLAVGRALNFFEFASLFLALIGTLCAGHVSAHGVELAFRQHFLVFFKNRHLPIVAHALGDTSTDKIDLLPTKHLNARIMTVIENYQDGVLTDAMLRKTTIEGSKGDLTAFDDVALDMPREQHTVTQSSSLSFRRPDLEIEYGEFQASRSVKILRVLAVTFLVAEAFFGLQDYWVVTDKLLVFLLVRYCVLCPIILTFVGVARMTAFQGRGQQMLIVVLLLSFGVANTVLNALLPPTALLANMVYYAVMLRYLMHVFCSVRLRYILTIMVGSTIAFVFVMVDLNKNNWHFDFQTNPTPYFLAICIVGALAAYRAEQRYRFLFLLTKLVHLVPHPPAKIPVPVTIMPLSLRKLDAVEDEFIMLPGQVPAVPLSAVSPTAALTRDDSRITTDRAPLSPSTTSPTLTAASTLTLSTSPSTTALIQPTNSANNITIID